MSIYNDLATIEAILNEPADAVDVRQILTCLQEALLRTEQDFWRDSLAGGQDLADAAHAVAVARYTVEAIQTTAEVYRAVFAAPVRMSLAQISRARALLPQQPSFPAATTARLVRLK